MVKVKDKIQRWKLLADIFIKNNSKVFIKTINGDLHFCILVLNGENSILIDNFAPEQRKGKREKIWWLEVEEFEEYREKSSSRNEGVENVKSD